MGFGYYDRQGYSMPANEWAESFGKQSYKRVAETTLPDGKWVSTVWLGLDHRFGDDGLPLIFETMVFNSKVTMQELDVARYSTEAEAIAGHAERVKTWTEHPEGANDAI